MSDVAIGIKSINELFGMNFVIPDYQRGYRWTQVQVEQLLTDIRDFMSSDDKFYCLQPIVLQKLKEENAYNVIDGQQRLTTLFLILKTKEELCKEILPNMKLYTMEYSTKEKLIDIVRTIDDGSFDKNDIDVFFIKQAYETIKNWFTDSGVSIVNFLNALLIKDIKEIDKKQIDAAKNVRVIWYVINDELENPVDIFTRLNIGKIPLTNSELVKALFLRGSNFLSPKELELRQIQIASEWDEIEKKLQNKEFWYFISNEINSQKYEDRIEYIFDLITSKTKDSEFYFTFNYFSSIFSKAKTQEDRTHIVDTEWLQIKKYFLTLEEWFSDNVLYHYIGYLIDCSVPVESIKKAYEKNAKDQFITNYIIPEIKKQINLKDSNDITKKPSDVLEGLEYGDIRIRKILLLLNIQTIIETHKSDMRFPFSTYKRKGWDIEHVSSQTEKTFTGEAEQREWISDMLRYFTGEDDDQKVANYITSHTTEVPIKFSSALLRLKQNKKIDSDEFKGLYNRIQTFFEEDTEVEDKNNISNLALLNPEINRSYGNAFFPVKRQYIIRNDRDGIFIPIATKNLFLKYYSGKMSDVMYWKKEDASSYLEAIKDTLKDFLK
jgi:uncharacterized protein with ParB-like and HNH nuclease domain